MKNLHRLITSVAYILVHSREYFYHGIKHDSMNLDLISDTQTGEKFLMHLSRTRNVSMGHGCPHSNSSCDICYSNVHYKALCNMIWL